MVKDDWKPEKGTQKKMSNGKGPILKVKLEKTRFKIQLVTYSRSSTRRGQTPASITAWILSFVPSERYDNAQHASVRTSSSFECIR